MSDGKAAVGQRIRDCAEHLGIKGPQALCDLVLAELKNRNERQTVTRQTLSNWWHGKVYPSLDMLPALAAVLHAEQEWILFGSRRGEQLRRERLYLSRVSEEEALLLTAYREANKGAQKSILKMARSLAEDHPAPEATVHPMRRKDDKISRS